MYFVVQVIGGCVSGRDELVSKVRIYHHVVGGVLNPVCLD
jgi:cystathionine gamma-synthase